MSNKKPHDYETLSIKIPSKLMEQINEITRDNNDVTQGLLDQIEIMTQDLIRDHVARHREKRVVEDNLDMFSG